MSAPGEPSEDDQLRAFRACPKFDVTQAASQCPEIMGVMTLISNTLGVCVPWVLAAALVIAAGLVPQARYELAPSVSVPSSMWIILLHPGATNSSGVIKLVVETVQLLMSWLAELEEQQAKRETAEGEEVVYPPRRQLLAGGGSLAATGMQMSQHQNRSAALCAEPEIGQLLQWFSCDSGIDASAVAKLWDGTAWDRPVMDRSKAFTICNPWLSTITGAHIPDTVKVTKKDVFGMRKRVTALFGEPLWLTMAETRENCSQLPIASRIPAEFLAALLFPLLLWSAKHKELVYTASDLDGAREHSDRNFDNHLAMQKEAFLRPGQHSAAKYHGKLRTKFDRMALATHFLSSICGAFRAWSSANGPEAKLTCKENWCPAFTVGLSFRRWWCCLPMVSLIIPSKSGECLTSLARTMFCPQRKRIQQILHQQHRGDWLLRASTMLP